MGGTRIEETMAELMQRPSPAAHAVPHLTAEERVKLGKEARTRAPRSSQAEFSPAVDRPDPVGLLERQGITRVPELVPIRYGRMLVSPFTFFRGAALIMASDLATTPRSGLNAQVCGDAHLSNFGLFASPERKLMFDVNDFDETLPGPWEWDLKRLAASVVIAARDREFTDKEARAAALEVGASYRREMARLAGLSTLDVWYSHIDVAGLLAELEAAARKSGSRADKHMAARTAQVVTKAHARDSLQALGKLATVVDGQLRIVSDPPLIVPTEELFPQDVSDEIHESFHQLVRGYRRSLQSDRRHLLEEFQFVQIARKVVGVGSVGTRAWILLMVGMGNDDPALPPSQRGGGVRARGVRRQERLRQPWGPGGGRPTSDAGSQRHLPRLPNGRRSRRCDQGLLRSPTTGLEGELRGRGGDPSGPDQVRRGVCPGPGARARPLG